MAGSYDFCEYLSKWLASVIDGQGIWKGFGSESMVQQLESANRPSPSGDWYVYITGISMKGDINDQSDITKVVLFGYWSGDKDRLHLERIRKKCSEVYRRLATTAVPAEFESVVPPAGVDVQTANGCVFCTMEINISHLR